MPDRAAGRRELVIAALLCAAGAGLTAGFAGRTWATVTEHVGGGAPLTQSLSGSSLSGSVAALGWAGLAGLAALVATRRWARTAVGVLLAVFGLGVAFASASAVRHSHVISVAGDKSNFARLGSGVAVTTNAWWTVSLAGGVLLAAAGIITMVRGHRWPGMSARYERPAAARPAVADDPVSLWKSLDRGEDPTSAAPPDA